MNDLIGEMLTAKWEDDPTDPNTAEKLVPGWYLTFSYFDAETGTQLSDPFISLPSVQDARTLSFAVSSDMRQLLEARERLKALLLGYQFVDYARNGKNGSESLGRWQRIRPQKMRGSNENEVLLAVGIVRCIWLR